MRRLLACTAFCMWLSTLPKDSSSQPVSLPETASFFFFFFSSNCTCAHTPAQHLLTHSGCAYTCLPAKHMTQLIITAGTCSFHHHMAKMQRKEKSRERGREWGCLRGSVEAKVGFLRLFSLSRHHKWQRCWRHIEKEERQNHKQQHSEVDSWQL